MKVSALKVNKKASSEQERNSTPGLQLTRKHNARLQLQGKAHFLFLCLSYNKHLSLSLNFLTNYAQLST